MKRLINACKDYTHLVDDDDENAPEVVRVNIAPRLENDPQPAPVWVEFTGVLVQVCEPVFGDDGVEWADLYETDGGMVLVKCRSFDNGPIVRQFEVLAFAEA